MNSRQARLNKTNDFNKSEVNDEGKSNDRTFNNDGSLVSTGPNLDEKDYSCEKKFYTHQFDN